MIVGFVHDVRMHKVDESKYPQAHIDTVQEAIGLLKGTKLRWFEINGQEYNPDIDPESKDKERMRTTFGPDLRSGPGPPGNNPEVVKMWERCNDFEEDGERLNNFNERELATRDECEELNARRVDRSAETAMSSELVYVHASFFAWQEGQDAPDSDPYRT
ncbi:uncharacterized protein FOMMEDRAFT_159825 [Fomitiporia mediterranea MF3/22]|uniref:uncharacterized protein n=1 Tax=Fomitiporia mediterranea (strain MF3/22) TaxID=694068 RepID=UPI0004409911|nr:uncharacterized protein FOMMEDRAFT_159825 [Fomitiporia mediterranea MF3/22]EJD00178.1 hypothetical protein FOMMEDRAFT_159825 [Fomitiporia mediterranea MF3/22]